MGMVDRHDMAALQALMGLVTWCQRGRSTRVVIDASMDGAGVFDVGVVNVDVRWLGMAGEGG